MRQFTIITKDGSKWLRRYHPDEVIYGEPRRYTLVPYIGSRPEGTILDESEVRELTQCRVKNAPSDKWQEIGFGKVPPPNFLFEARIAYTDAEPPDIDYEKEMPLNQSDNSALHKTSVAHSMSGDGMNSLEFFDMIKKEWCRSEEQYKSFWNDVLTFARKYHKERKEYGD